MGDNITDVIDIGKDAEDVLEFLYAKKLKEGSFVIDSQELSRILK